MEVETSEEGCVRRSIVDATVEHYSLLSETQEVNAKVASVISSACMFAKRLDDSLSKVQSLTQAMMRVGQQWRREKQIALTTVAQHQRLVLFLEAPSILYDCIRNEMYHEALMVLEHMTRSTPPMEKVELFLRVENDVLRVLEQSLLEVIFPRLSEQLTVASAVKITTFFRRLGLEEAQIRQVFLWKRAKFIDYLLHEAEESGVPYSCILRYVTAFKVHVSETILQYTACFSPDADSGTCTELVEWCHERGHAFVTCFRATVGKITNGSELASVVEGCFNSAAGTTLVRMDVSGLINEALIARVKELFAEQTDLAVQSYAASMRSFSWRPPNRLQWNSQRWRGETPTSAVLHPPPVNLLQWLPLAYALNGLLNAFNAIRKCVVPGIELFCVAQVERVLRIVAEDLTRDKELLMAVEGEEKQIYLHFVDAFVYDFYPHVVACVRELLSDDAQRLLTNSMRSSIEGLRSVIPKDEYIVLGDVVQQEKEVNAVVPEATDAATTTAVMDVVSAKEQSL